MDVFSKKNLPIVLGVAVALLLSLGYNNCWQKLKKKIKREFPKPADLLPILTAPIPVAEEFKTNDHFEKIDSLPCEKESPTDQTSYNSLKKRFFSVLGW